MKRKISYPMKGVLNVESGEIIFIDKNNVETVYDYKTLFEAHNGQDVKLKFDYEEFEEEDEE